MHDEYEELVRLLKDKAERFDYDGWVDTAVVMEKAADTIEKLVEVIQNHDFLESLIDPGWIPVTEPPKGDGWYQVYAPGYSGGSSSGLKNINGNMYSAFKRGKWSIEIGYHKRPGCVKAWMPLPKPPEWLKGETEDV